MLDLSKYLKSFDTPPIIPVKAGLGRARGKLWVLASLVPANTPFQGFVGGSRGNMLAKPRTFEQDTYAVHNDSWLDYKWGNEVAPDDYSSTSPHEDRHYPVLLLEGVEFIPAKDMKVLEPILQDFTDWDADHA